jgi:hypothetical protein
MRVGLAESRVLYRAGTERDDCLCRTAPQRAATHVEQKERRVLEQRVEDKALSSVVASPQESHSARLAALNRGTRYGNTTHR